MLIITDGLPRGLGFLEMNHPEVGVPGLPKHFEADTYTCSHCQRVVILNPDRKRERYRCNGCDHHICDDCAAKKAVDGRCFTWEQKIDEMRERDARQPPPNSIIMP